MDTARDIFLLLAAGVIILVRVVRKRSAVANSSADPDAASTTHVETDSGDDPETP